MGTEDAVRARTLFDQVGDPPELRCQVGHRCRDEGDQRPRGAVPPVEGDRCRQVSRRCGDVMPATTVHVQVDEARQEPAAAEIVGLL